MLAARVHRPDGSFGPLFDHLTLRVDLDEPWLVDVGFGRHAYYPLRADSVAPQQDPSGVYEVRAAADGDTDLVFDGTPAFRMEARPRVLEDFEPTCWWQETAPESHFTQSLTCSMLDGDGRVTISGDRLIRTTGESRVEETLNGDAAVLDAYRTIFGFELDRMPRLRDAS